MSRKTLILVGIIFFVVGFLIVTGIGDNFGKPTVRRDDDFGTTWVAKKPWPNVFGSTIVYTAYSYDAREDVSVKPRFFGDSIYYNRTHGKINFIAGGNTCMDSRPQRTAEGCMDLGEALRENAEREFDTIKQQLKVKELLRK